MFRLCLSFLLMACAAFPASAVPFWGAKQSSPADTAPAALKPGEFVWNPGVAPDGPIVVVVSLTEQRAYVYRNGVEVGRSRAIFSEPGKPVGTHAFIVKAGDGPGESVILKGAAARNWMAVPMPGYGETAGTDLPSVVGGRVHLPQDFARLLYPLLAPGTTLLVTDAPVLEENSGRQMTVMGAGIPN